MSPLNSLRRTLAEGPATLGYLVTMPSVQLVQALARTGVDWLMIDTEHSDRPTWPCAGRCRISST